MNNIFLLKYNHFYFNKFVQIYLLYIKTIFIIIYINKFNFNIWIKVISYLKIKKE